MNLKRKALEFEKTEGRHLCLLQQQLVRMVQEKSCLPCCSEQAAAGALVVTLCLSDCTQQHYFDKLCS